MIEPVASVGASAELARSVEQAVVVELGRHQELDVVSPGELQEALRAEKGKADLGCDSLEGCVVRVQQLLRAEHRVQPKLIQFGAEYELSLTLLDLGQTGVVRRAEAHGSGWKEIAPQIARVVAELLGAAPEPKLARLAVGDGLKLALLPLGALGVPEATARAMDQILAIALSRIDGVSVLSRDDVENFVRAIAAQGQAGCTDNFACIAEIGAALGLSKVVAGSVGQVGSTRLVALRVIDTRAVQVESRTLEDFQGDDLELGHAVRKAALDLLGVDQSAPPGGIDLTLNVARGEGRLGDRKFVFDGHRLQLQGLLPGRYDLEIVPAATEAFLPLRRDLYVPLGSMNARALDLDRAPERWYQKWWIWAAVGGVVAAGVTAAIIATHHTPGPQVALSIGGAQ